MQPPKIKVGIGKVVKYDPDRKKGVIVTKQEGKLFVFDNKIEKLDEASIQDLVVQFVESITENGNALATQVDALGHEKYAL